MTHVARLRVEPVLAIVGYYSDARYFDFFL